MTRTDRIIPTGTCWCGCGRETALGAFFAQGHDKIAEAAVLDLHFGGSVAQLLQANGYHPGNPVIKAAWHAKLWDACACGYHGRPASVARHLKQHEGDTAHRLKKRLRRASS